jgi:hypothetical protein
VLDVVLGASTEGGFGDMTKRWMPKIVGETTRLDRAGIYREHGGTRVIGDLFPGLCDRQQSLSVASAHLRHLQRVTETVMEGVAGLGCGNLGYVREATKR